MNVKDVITILFLTFLFVGCSREVKQEKTNPLTGLWSLHVMEKMDTETGKWNEWREGMQGYLLYDHKDNMSLHLTTKSYEHFDLEFPNFTDTIPQEALEHLTNSYVYFAKYTINSEENIVEHARFSHSNPKDWNKIVRRRFSFSGDT